MNPLELDTSIFHPLDTGVKSYLYLSTEELHVIEKMKSYMEAETALNSSTFHNIPSEAKM